MDIVQGGLPYPEFKIEFVPNDGWGGTRVEQAVGGITQNIPMIEASDGEEA